MWSLDCCGNMDIVFRECRFTNKLLNQEYSCQLIAYTRVDVAITEMTIMNKDIKHLLNLKLFVGELLHNKSRKNICLSWCR